MVRLTRVLAGVVFSILHAVASINLKADQVISGTALNILAGGLTVYLCQIIFHQQRTRAFSNGIQKFSVPGLSDIPVLGRMFFKEIYPTFYIAISNGVHYPVCGVQRRRWGCANESLRLTSPGRRQHGQSTSQRCAISVCLYQAH